MNKILIVENEPIARNYLKRALEQSGAVLEASSAADTLDIFRNQPDIDVLVCNVELGLVSGMELASLLRAWNGNLCAVLTSDLPCDQWTERQEMELSEISPDAVLILEKPFTANELRAAVAKLNGQEMLATSAARA